MRTRLAAAAAGALALTAAVPAQAAVVKKKRLQVRVGRTALVVGNGTTAGVAALQIQRGGGWRTLDRDRTTAAGRYVLRDRQHRPLSARARVVVDGVARPVGRLNAYRAASASWYGPGLYGNALGCGGTLTQGRLGVAHKTLPCGSKLTLRKGSRTLRVRVIDRGPFVGGREFDLTEATARRLGFRAAGTVLTTR